MKHVLTLESFLVENDKSKVIDLYKAGKSQAEIASDLKISITKVANWTKHLGHQVGLSDEDEERYGDDPSSKQYYDRSIRSKK
jgi:transposase-like protein